ncbi:MAG: hypothetical protein HY698_03450 [Deltaproteobacteria bacterium]|nr:hypothetical protein [Deltaproteobacteria bacterium]
MRTKILTGFVLITLLACVLWVVQRHGDVNAKTHDSSLPEAIAMPGVGGNKPLHESGVGQGTPDRPELQQAEVLRFKLSGEKRRDGEGDAQYKLRQLYVEQFRDFFEQARLTPEQEQQILRIVADGEANHQRAWEASRKQVDEVLGDYYSAKVQPKEGALEYLKERKLPITQEAKKAIEEEVAVETRKILTPEQFKIFEGKILIPLRSMSRVKVIEVDTEGDGPSQASP